MPSSTARATNSSGAEAPSRNEKYVWQWSSAYAATRVVVLSHRQTTIIERPFYNYQTRAGPPLAFGLASLARFNVARMIAGELRRHRWRHGRAIPKQAVGRRLNDGSIGRGCAQHLGCDWSRRVGPGPPVERGPWSRPCRRPR